MARKIQVVAAFAPLALATTAFAGPPPPGFADRIHVRFAEGADVSPPTDALSPALAASVSSIVKLFTLPAGTLDALAAAREDLPDLNLWFEIRLNMGIDPGNFLDQLRALASVDVADFAPLASPLTALTPDFTGNQGYLGLAPDGIDANFSATIPGGDGTGITIYDVEYSWNQSHEDLSKAAGVTLLVDAGDTAVDPFNDNNHGTAVLGELIADNDTKGVTGISFGANIGLAPSNTQNLGYNMANAILLAAADGKAGDVILIEQQTAACSAGPCDSTQVGCGPAEWNQPVFDAIQTAVANRITVVEAAGNGSVDLDQANCNSRFDRTVRDSGAIIVGAGGSPAANDRERLSFSSFGSRVDVQAWGASVMTTGYGFSYVDPDDPTNPNRWYRDTFGGTSSASPIVAGAVANLQGIALQRFGTPLLAFQLRLLLQETGSPQLGDTTKNIGPRPDLQGAIARLTEGAIDLFMIVDLSGSFADDLVNFKAQAPSIVNNIRAENPNVRFGLAKFEDYPISPFGNPDPAREDTAYSRLLDLTFDTTMLLDTIANLPAPVNGDGGDEPQSQLPALFQAASGAGQDLSGQGFAGASISAGQQANFRDGVTKLFLLWTDAAFHLPGDAGPIPYPGPSFVDTVTAIQALDPPQVIGISSGPQGVTDLEAMALATGALAPMGGVDCDGNGGIDIAEGEPLVCEIAPSGAGIAEAIVRLVQAVVAASTPVARCMDVETTTDPGVCGATVSVDNGSFDPDGGTVTLFQSPQGPYPVGESAVTLKVTDETGLTDFCVATVTVVDDEPPVPMCDTTPVTPPDAPTSLMATATDNCAVSTEITEFDCFKFTNKGKRVDKTGACNVSVAGDSLTIDHTGGVGDHISWTVVATDENGNVAQTGCEVIVGNPGKGKP